MAVVGTAGELPDSPSANFQSGKQSFTRRFAVMTDSYSDGPITVLQATNIPQPGAPYVFGNESNIVARVRNYNPKRSAPNSLLWHIEVQYDTPDPEDGEEDPDQEDNPLLEPPQISWDSESGQEAIVGLLAGGDGSTFADGVKNSAGEVFEGITYDVTTPIITITRNEPITTDIIAIKLEYENAVNSDTFWGASPGQARMIRITGQKHIKTFSNGFQFSYMQNTYTIQFKKTWELEIADRGNYYIDGTNQQGEPNKVKFLTDDGHPVIGWLDGSGGKLAEGEPIVFLDPKQLYKKIAFGPLNLPQSFQ